MVGCSPGILLPEGRLLRDVYVRGRPSVPSVALTFDDGPNGKCTEAVLDALREAGAPGTFFVVGSNVTHGRNEWLLARMVREGHTIGVHSMTHAARPFFLRHLAARELTASRAAIADALRRAGVHDPPPLTFFRPPYGFLTAGSARAAAEQGMAIVEWTVSVQDWEHSRTPDAVTNAILANVRPGDVIVLHDGNETHQRSRERCRDRPNAAAVVRQLIPALAARGLHPAPLADVLGLEPAPVR